MHVGYKNLDDQAMSGSMDFEAVIQAIETNTIIFLCYLHGLDKCIWNNRITPHVKRTLRNFSLTELIES